MSNHHCIFVSPRDRAIFQMNQELLKMTYADMTYLLTQAQLLNAARLEQEATLRRLYPLTEDTTHAE